VIVADLTPGDLIENAGQTALYVAQAEHPIWPHLRLVIWRLSDGTWSFDALDSHQEVGERLSRNEPPGRRELRLRDALLSGEASPS
jgi:hypothetical protein